MKGCYAIELDQYAIAIADLYCINHRKNRWLLTRLHVPRQFREEGYGSQLLRMVLDDADREGASIELTVMASGGLCNAELEEWYGRYGFERQKLVDGSKSCLMLRLPAGVGATEGKNEKRF